LLGALTGTVLAAWLATAGFSYLDARRRIGQMLDEHLVQAATLLLEAGAGTEAPRPPVHWGPREEGHTLVYQGRSALDGALLFRSDDAPEAPLSPQHDGFSTVERDGRQWHVYGAQSGGLRVQVAEHAEFRDELAASVARHLLHPLAIAVPVLALLIWLSVRWSLRPLRALAAEVGRREPTSVQPLDAPGAPDEVRPLVAALDTLFLRLAASVEAERRFTADAAHELRTPLAAIRTHAEVALGARDEAERASALASVIEGISRINRLVGQLLLLARLDARAASPSSAPLSLGEIAARQVAEAAPFAAEKGVNLGLVEAAGARAPGDADLLGVLLRNLIDNAIRYTPAGGRVDVVVAEDAGRAILTVADSGPGVPADERPRLLERFFRGAARTEEGSGLGLSIVARIAELHRAPLTFGEGLEGQGISVTVSLPRV
jgi:two-component system sensor histidine kinase QseC